MAATDEEDIFSPPACKPTTSRHSIASTCVPQSPMVTCTPVKQEWVTRCECACNMCPYPTTFHRDLAGKAQDRLTVDVRPGSRGGALWAVFDGHFSHEVAAHAVREVPKLVWSSPLWPSSPGEALCGALHACHESARREGVKGGSTAVVLAATGDDLWCCSAGDSRVVAGLRGGGVRRLSVEHTAKLPGEEARVVAAGGYIEAGSLEGLAMTRGIGNFNLEGLGFACLPDVQSIPRAEVEFVVVASDGLWDVVSDEECCELVRGCGGANVAEHLVDTARRLGSADDVAVVAVSFPRQHQQKQGGASPPVWPAMWKSPAGSSPVGSSPAGFESLRPVIKPIKLTPPVPAPPPELPFLAKLTSLFDEAADDGEEEAAGDGEEEA